jgi:hypothetical protein
LIAAAEARRYHAVTRREDRAPAEPVPAKPEGARDPGGEASEGDAAGEQASETTARKERVLHTRVPAVLERELKRFADNLRIPVSNLVRTILEDAVSVADAAGDRVEERLKNAARQLEHERERLKKKVQFDPLADVFAYQAVTIAQAAACTKCGAELRPGARAHLGLTDGGVKPPGGRIFVCDDCLPRG